MQKGTRSLSDKMIVFVAEGFGAGRIPYGPGTFGTVVGFAWVYLLLLSRSLPLYIAAIIIGFFVAVCIGERAEKILKKKDPGSIVIDEIAAVPLAFLPAVIMTKPYVLTMHPSSFLTREYIILPILSFVLFRFFDIVKPLGIRRVQSRHWGLVVDDYLAAILAALVLLAYMLLAARFV